jgi:hypothetical protein
MMRAEGPRSAKSYGAGEIAVTISGVVVPITTSPTLIFFSISCLAMVLAL